MNKKYVLYSTLLTLLPGALAAENSTTVFREEFDSYGNDYQGFNTGSSIWEYPPSLKIFTFSPEKYSKIRNENYYIAESRRSVNSELHFSFSFDPKSQKKLDLHFSLENENGKKDYVIEIRDGGSLLKPVAGSTISKQTRISKTQMPIAPIVFNRMHKAMLKIQGRYMEFYVERDGKMVRDLTANLDKGMLAGFNFASDSTFQLDHIKVRSELQNHTFPEAWQAIPAAKDTAAPSGWKPQTVYIANEHTDIPISFDKNDGVLSFELTLNSYPADFSISTSHAADKKITFTSIAQTADHQVLQFVEEEINGKKVKTAKNVNEKILLPDFGFAIKNNVLGIKNLCTRPFIKYHYNNEGTARVIANWENYPAASKTPICFEMRKDSVRNLYQLWANGSYIAEFPMDSSGCTDVILSVPAGSVIKKSEAAYPMDKDHQYTILDFSKYQDAGKGYDVKFSHIKNKLIRPFSTHVPNNLNGKIARIDTGLCEENLGSFMLECDGFLQTEALDGIPGRFMFQVPKEQYLKAWLYCAVDPHPDKVPVVTARLTEVSGQGRSQARCDAIIELPDPNSKNSVANDKIKQVGTVVLKNGKEVPLYQVECCFDVGSIQDLIFDPSIKCLNFEILGNLYEKDSYYIDKTMKPSEEQKSSVQVFAATLEKSPVSFQVTQNRVTNVYYPDEKAGMTVHLTAIQDDTCILQSTVSNADGEILEKYEEKINLKKDKPQDIQIDFKTKEYGWYPVNFALLDKDGKKLMQHQAAFTLIAPNKRKWSTQKSPYFSWNFMGAHGTPRDINIWGDILLRMGVRKTLLPNTFDKKKWPFTLGQFPHLHIKGNTEAEREASAKALIENNLKKHPGCTTALIFHENGGGPFPMELIGEKMQEDPGGKNTYDKALEAAKYWRKFAPHIKLQIGNTGDSLGGIGRLFRNNFPEQYIDYMGEESVGMTMLPEHSTSYFLWALAEMARIFGYENVKPNPCFEWRSRIVRHQGKIKVAEQRVRDALIAHVWDCELIPVIGISEMANSYYNTIWGDAAFTRYPLLNPEASFTATQVMTQVMDQVKFSRLIPTGSATVYAAEFKRGNQYVYALWTADGEQKAKLQFKQKAQGILTEMLGKESKVAADVLDIEITESPAYLTLNVPIQNIMPDGNRSFKKHNKELKEKLGSQKVYSIALDSKDQLKVVPGRDARLEFNHTPNPVSMGLRSAGNYELQNINDAEKGQCVAIRLLPASEPVKTPLMSEYGVFRLNEPIVLPGKPTTIGAEVYGNSSWGKFFWELEDADGEIWLSAGSTGYGCNVHDWPDKAGFSFDGWKTMAFPIAKESPITVYAPGENEWQWQHAGSNGDNQITYPVKLKGIAVALNRKSLVLKDMQDVEPVVKIKSISVWE